MPAIPAVEPLPPAPQASPTAQRDPRRAAADMAAGFGMNDTVLTSPMGTTTGTPSRRAGTLLGL
jgi:hypothetical protein